MIWPLHGMQVMYCQRHVVARDEGREVVFCADFLVLQWK